MCAMLMKVDYTMMWQHFKKSLSGTYENMHAQLGMTLSSAIDNHVFEYDEDEFNRRDSLAKRGEAMSLVLCRESMRGRGCPDYRRCRFLHKRGTNYTACQGAGEQILCRCTGGRNSIQGHRLSHFSW